MFFDISFVNLLLATIFSLLPIVNPFSTAPLFLAITEGFDDETRREQARLGVIYMCGIQFVINGLIGVASDPDHLGRILEGLNED